MQITSSADLIGRELKFEDRVVFDTLDGGNIEYMVMTDHMSAIGHNNSQIFKALSEIITDDGERILSKDGSDYGFAARHYGYWPTGPKRKGRNQGHWPPYKTRDYAAITRLVQRIFERLEEAAEERGMDYPPVAPRTNAKPTDVRIEVTPTTGFRLVDFG